MTPPTSGVLEHHTFDISGTQGRRPVWARIFRLAEEPYLDVLVLPDAATLPDDEEVTYSRGDMLGRLVVCGPDLGVVCVVRRHETAVFGHDEADRARWALHAMTTDEF